jgi:hypothetical protein
LFLPRYSPDLNPIEQVFAKFKTTLRKTDPRTIGATWRGIGELLGLPPPNGPTTSSMPAILQPNGDHDLQAACRTLASDRTNQSLPRESEGMAKRSIIKLEGMRSTTVRPPFAAVWARQPRTNL